jgi:hypothetical protein
MLGIYFDKYYDYKSIMEYEESVINTSNTESVKTQELIENAKNSDINMFRLMNELSLKIHDNDVIKIKINEVVKQMDKSKPSPNKIVKDSQVMVILLGYELLKKCKEVLNDKK